MRPTDGSILRAEPIAGGSQRMFKMPVAGDAVLYLWLYRP
jgi:hypothetical protein